MKNVITLTIAAVLNIASFSTDAQGNNLSAAAVDVAGAKICDRLENRFRGLPRENEQGEQVYSGTLWIHSCGVRYDNASADSLTLDLGVKGWRWLERDKEKLGADFNVSEFARFDVDVSLTGRVTTHYDQQAKKLAFWFKPEKSPQVDFNASGDVDVDKEGMWGTVLAGAATLVGHSPDTLADKTLVEKGEQRFTRKMADGFSSAIDFCSGRVFSSLGQLDQATLFSQIDKAQQADFQQVDLVPSSFLLFGPYGEQSELLDLQLRLDSPDGLQNKLICMDDAIELANAYMEGTERTPEVPGIELVKGDGDTVSLRNADKSCPVVAMFSTDKQVVKRTAIAFKVRDYSEPTPLLKCD